LKLFDREDLYKHLQQRGLGDWVQNLRAICTERLAPTAHGNMPKWISAWEKIPTKTENYFDASGRAVRVGSESPAQDQLAETLMQFHPWRKGPFEVNGIPIDTEWRSDLKWNRLAEKVDFKGKTILDMGCGNGYYGWRMLDAGAKFVLGCDPLLLYIMQFEAIRKFASKPERNFVMPLADNELPTQLSAFDVALSMGVLYHRSSPIDHLQIMQKTLVPGGQLIIETLIVGSTDATVLVPEDRYAKMRNVWFIPSLTMLELWLRRTGFQEISVLDVTATTSDEQRKTKWMTFESLENFLDPSDATKTIEGYPAPLRATLTARRSG
jgi:tRNA (mo5U34)-methyltransferase